MSTNTNQKLTPEIQAVIDRLKFGQPNDTLCLFIPSHDRDNKKVDGQAKWAGDALELFGKLYGGATAFKFLEGVFDAADEKKLLFDQPIMVQTLTGRERLEDAGTWAKLGKFCQDLGETLNQHSVGLIVNDYFYTIKISRKKK
jgi:hypothetical protein